jgi:hypothetical protein
MRALFSILPLLLALYAHAAPTVSLAWDPSPDADVVNYRLYWGPSSGTYNGSADLGNVTNTVFTQLVPGGHYFFVVTAFNVAGAESDPSNELDYLVPSKPRPPTEFRITQSLQAAATPLGPWSDIGTNVVLRTATNDSEFYRVVLAIEKER